MAAGSRGIVRRLSAAAFLVVGAWAITATAARSLDAQGDDRLAEMLSHGRTEQQWLRLSEKMGTGKSPLDDASVAELRRLAVRRPLSPIPFFLTGANRKLHGDRQPASLLVGLAVQRDPRFLPARYWRVSDALAAEQVEEATRATLRVLVLHPEAVDQTVPILVQLTRDSHSWPQIRTALPAGQVWRDAYFKKLVESGFDPSIVFSAIDVARGLSGKPPSNNDQATLLRAMVGRNDYERAYTAWLGWLPLQALSRLDYLYDGNFTGAPGPEPFNWVLSASGNGTAGIDGNHGLRFDVSPSENVELAREVMLLPPGRYRLSTVAVLDDTLSPDTKMPLIWQLTCVKPSTALATLTLPNSLSEKREAAEFEVAPDCVAQQLRLAATAMEFPVRIGGFVHSVAIEKLP